MNVLPPGEIAALDIVIHGPLSTRKPISVTDTDGNNLGGIDTGDGCLRSFYTQIFGSLEKYVEYLSADLRVQNANQVGHAALQIDPGFVGLVAGWSDCMSARGFQYKNPLDPFSTDWPSPRPSDQERQVAVADMACKESTDFLAAARVVRGEVQARVAAELQIEEETRGLTDAGRRLASSAAS